jgi:hypothetical protein
MSLDYSYEDIDFKPTNASYYRRELKKAQAEIEELNAKIRTLRDADFTEQGVFSYGGKMQPEAEIFCDKY